MSSAGRTDNLRNLLDEKAATAPHLQDVFASFWCKSFECCRASRGIVRGPRSGPLNLCDLTGVLHGPTIVAQVDMIEEDRFSPVRCDASSGN
jgi:hypothetical protein